MTPQDLNSLADREITHSEALLLEAYGPLEMARVIEALAEELAWIHAFATVRSQDDSKTFARVNRGALRTIAGRAASALRAHSIGEKGE